MTSLRSEFILSLEAVMMGEEDPARPHRYYCYHFYPRMSGDVQSYLTRLGQGALSNVLMKHKESPSMLQLVVDNVKHILGCVLRGMEYLHGNNIVHNDIKRELYTYICHIHWCQPFCHKHIHVPLTVCLLFSWKDLLHSPISVPLLPLTLLPSSLLFSSYI